MHGLAFFSSASLRKITLPVASCLAMGLLAAGSAQAAGTVTVVDTLGAATPATQFSVFGGGGISLLPTQFVGPKFDLVQGTVLTEIGAFVNTSALPATVAIVPAGPDGLPDGTHVLASYLLTSDGDPFSVSYESVEANLGLSAGTYYALFGVQDDDAGVLLASANDPFTYQAGLIPTGFLNPTTGQSSASPGEFMAVRILGPTAADLLATLAAKVVDVGPGASLADKVAQAQAALNAGDSATTSAILGAFTNQVSAQAGKTISPDTASMLIEDATQIRAMLA